MHGYAIAKRIKESSSGALTVEEGSLYPALNRMLVKGWIGAEWGVSENNRKARFYELTRAGRKQLATEEGEFHALVAAIRLVLEQA
jgi:transcriptional regulator